MNEESIWHSRVWILAAGAIALALSAATAKAGEPFSLRDHVKLSASDRMRGEFVSWFDPGAGANSDYNFFANRLRVGATLTLPTVAVVVEGQDTRLVNLPGADAIVAGVGPLGPGAIYFANTHKRDQGEVFLHRAYATLHDFGLPGVSARVGRFGYNNGLERPPKDPTLLWLQKARISQRLIGDFEYTNVGRSFDGVQAMYDRGPFNLTLMASHPTYGGFEVSANKEIDKVDLVAGTATLVEPEGIAPLGAQLFYIYYGDRRDLKATDNRPAPPPGTDCALPGNRRRYAACDSSDIQISTIGGNVTHVVRAGPGKLDLLGWVAGQLGDWESLDQHAWAYAVEAGYQLPDVAWKPWMRLGFFRSSGDGNPSDDDHGTFFQIIPTARLYAAFPFYNLMNDQDLFVQMLLKPLPGLSANVSGHWLRVTESADLWYAGGGATSNTFFGYAGIDARGRHELAYLVDLEVSYAVNRHLTVYAYYGHAFGQGVVSASFAGRDADYGYIEPTVAF